MKTITFDESSVKEYFKFLGPFDDTIQTVSFLDINSEDVIKGYGVRFGTVTEVIEVCCKIQLPYTLHSCLNLTNLKGRQTQHFVGCRVLCLDIDDKRSNEEIKSLVSQYDPGMIVESSPSKFHIYWKIETNLEQWKIYQLSLAYKFGGDLNLDQISKTIRVPGVERVCKDGTKFMPKIVYLNPMAVGLDDKNIIERFPWLMEAFERGKQVKVQNANATRIALKQAKKDRLLHVVETPIAGRNSSLFSEVREGVIEGKFSKEEASEMGKEIAHEVNGTFVEPLSESEVDKTAKSAVKSGLEALSKKQERVEAARQSLGPIGFDYDYESRDLRINRFTDGAYIERMYQRHGRDTFKANGAIYGFNEACKRWELQKPLHGLLQKFAMNIAHDVINDERFIDECCTTGKGEFSEAMKVREENKWLNCTKQSGLIHAFKNHPLMISRELSECDADPNLFHFKNGIVSLFDGTIREAKAEDYLIRQVSYCYDKDARCLWWEKFLAEVFAENQTPDEMVEFLQAIFGYTLTGNIDEQCIYVHKGEGANGKSMVLGCLQMLLGDYADIIEPGAFCQNTKLKEFSRLGTQFENRRCMIIDDLDTKSAWDESLVKALTSSPIRARLLYNEERKIPNRAKIHLGCNETPQTDAASHAVFRRLRMLNYDRTFDVNPVKYREIQEKIVFELPGIFNWAMRGLRNIQENGGKIKCPEESLLAIDDYKSETFDITDFFDKLFVKPEEHEIEENWKPISELVLVINNYLIGIGKRDKHVSPESVGRKFTKFGFKIKRERLSLHSDNKTRFYSVKLLGTSL